MVFKNPICSLPEVGGGWGSGRVPSARSPDTGRKAERSEPGFLSSTLEHFPVQAKGSQEP